MMNRIYEILGYPQSNIKAKTSLHKKFTRALAQKFSLPEEAFELDNFFEQKVLEHVSNECSVPSHPNRADDAVFYFYNENFIVHFPSFEFSELKKLNKAYNNKYSNICKILEDFKISSNNKIKPDNIELINALSFNINDFLNRVLVNMDATLNNKDKFFYHRDKTEDEKVYIINDNSQDKIYINKVIIDEYKEKNPENLETLSSLVLIIKLIKEKFDIEYTQGLYNKLHPECIALSFTDNKATIVEGHQIYNHSKPIDYMTYIDPNSILRKKSSIQFYSTWFIFDSKFLQSMVKGLKALPTPSADEIRSMHRGEQTFRC